MRCRERGIGGGCTKHQTLRAANQHYFTNTQRATDGGGRERERERELLAPPLCRVSPCSPSGSAAGAAVVAPTQAPPSVEMPPGLCAASAAWQCFSTCALNAASAPSAMIPGLAPTPKVHSCTQALNDTVRTDRATMVGTSCGSGSRTAATGEDKGPGARCCTIY